MSKTREFYVTRGSKLYLQVIKKLEEAAKSRLTPQWWYDNEPMVIKDIVLTAPDTFVICLES